MAIFRSVSDSTRVLAQGTRIQRGYSSGTRIQRGYSSGNIDWC